MLTLEVPVQEPPKFIIEPFWYGKPLSACSSSVNHFIIANREHHNPCCAEWYDQIYDQLFGVMTRDDFVKAMHWLQPIQIPSLLRLGTFTDFTAILPQIAEITTEKFYKKFLEEMNFYFGGYSMFRNTVGFDIRTVDFLKEHCYEQLENYAVVGIRRDAPLEVLLATGIIPTKLTKFFRLSLRYNRPDVLRECIKIHKEHNIPKKYSVRDLYMKSPEVAIEFVKFLGVAYCPCMVGYYGLYVARELVMQEST